MEMSAAAERGAKRLGIALYRDGLRQHAPRLTMQLTVPEAVDEHGGRCAGAVVADR